MTVMNKSDDIKELACALCQFQRVIVKGAKKVRDGQVGNQKYRYADLKSVWDAIREPLTANGLSVAQTFLESDPSRVIIETTLMHSSGEWIGGSLTMPLVKTDPQGAGSAITYGRRYALCAILGIYQEDDDAQSHQHDRDRKSTEPVKDGAKPAASQSKTEDPPTPRQEGAKSPNVVAWENILTYCEALGVLKEQAKTYLESEGKKRTPPEDWSRGPNKVQLAFLVALGAKLRARAQALEQLKARLLAKHEGRVSDTNEELCVWIDESRVDWFAITPQEILEARK